MPDNIGLTDGSPEHYIADHEITADKDIPLLMSALKKFVIFDGVDEDVLLDLIDGMGVYEYEDGEDVMRQDDAGCQTVFIVAQGIFEVYKDGQFLSNLETGATFGENVLLKDGKRQASVQARGESPRLYGIGAEDVNDMMQMRYEETHKEVMVAMTRILDSGACDQLLGLNAFQRHELYTVPKIRHFDSGAVMMAEGHAWLEEVFVLLQGSIVLRTSDGGDLSRVPRYSMLGTMGVLFGNMAFSVVADGSVKVLAISKKCLSDLFGADSMSAYLMRPLICRQLEQEAVCFTSFQDEQCEELSQKLVIRKVEAGVPFDTTGLRLLMRLDGDIEESTDDFQLDIKQHRGSNLDIIGVENLLNKDAVWKSQIRVCLQGQTMQTILTDTNATAFVAAWVSADVDPIVTKDDSIEKIRVLRTVYLFQTLTPCQVQQLAECMQTHRYDADETIFSQGDMGDFFCIISSGRVSVERNGRYIRSLGAGDYFGDRALMTHEARSATITVSEKCEIFMISAETFKSVMPPAAFQYLETRLHTQDSEFRFNDFIFLRNIGEGGFGVVKLVEKKATGASIVRFALKCVRKEPLVSNGHKDSLLYEREVMMSIDHPFIIRLVQTFRNEAYVFFLLELATGGELLDVLKRFGTLDKVQTQFYAGSIILAFQYLHARRIAYLDLKAENVMLDQQGYIKLVDFGIAQKVEGGLYGMKGSPHFMAPEMITSKTPYFTTADLWSLGVNIYEFMTGKLPFGNGSTNPFEVLEAVLNGNVQFPPALQKAPYGEEAMSLISGLLQRLPSNRLGGCIDGYKALHQHVFFQDLVFDDLLARRVTPPFIPEKDSFAEGDSDDPNSGKDLHSVEKKAERQELMNGWVDPDPGWDEDFSATH